ncbi:ketosteroid isomerase [Gordonia sp. SID5947]|uniref:nuclear transport factor 2 family protein n=1 Tax=Gordonia sp. SID5947 TaxID=2690315 RepID=UPI00136E0E22|nr:nuclear transport factor 2 family protein [Gordonia sp. SID5947]MYR05772.1 ketosteroid isomerase [Gordonia sp. SID5947]
MTIDELADRFFAAIEAGDTATLRAMYTDDAMIWHNEDRSAQTVDQNLRVLGWLSRTVARLRYRDVRRIVHDSGFVQQHVLTGVLDDGTELSIPAALFVDVTDEMICRIDEYVDSAHIAPLRAMVARDRAAGTR